MQARHPCALRVTWNVSERGWQPCVHRAPEAMASGACPWEPLAMGSGA